ncbi:hypothetical protein PoB_006972300 [Plakobranchus ocellatus]|uniref:Uncharacterized protein n=1 Tax=Plakobranchus ocellatus TaxID=259542 RepID=A0AAV4DG07_9GAST|nr:hypothetical protein PoB_006972300 [Plakobranchus ocellatus]
MAAARKTLESVGRILSQELSPAEKISHTPTSQEKPVSYCHCSQHPMSTHVAEINSLAHDIAVVIPLGLESFSGGQSQSGGLQTGSTVFLAAARRILVFLVFDSRFSLG